MRRDVLWDSSAVLAYLDSQDANHHFARELVTRMTAERRTGFMTNYLRAECHALLLSRLGRGIAHDWLHAEALPVVHATAHDEQRARAILLRHADKDWSFCDAISFAVMESRRVTTAFSFDRHFRQVGRFTILGPPR